MGILVSLLTNGSLITEKHISSECRPRPNALEGVRGRFMS